MKLEWEGRPHVARRGWYGLDGLNGMGMLLRRSLRGRVAPSSARSSLFPVRNSAFRGLMLLLLSPSVARLGNGAGGGSWQYSVASCQQDRFAFEFFSHKSRPRSGLPWPPLAVSSSTPGAYGIVDDRPSLGFSVRDSFLLKTEHCQLTTRAAPASVANRQQRHPCRRAVKAAVIHARRILALLRWFEFVEEVAWCFEHVGMSRAVRVVPQASQLFSPNEQFACGRHDSILKIDQNPFGIMHVLFLLAELDGERV